MEQSNTCYCDDPDHELCWDGMDTFPNKNWGFGVLGYWIKLERVADVENRRYV